MPTRILREGINSSTRVNALSMGAELLFRRLMSVADDYGRFYGAAATIRGACWPINPHTIRDEEVANWMIECCRGERPLISMYQHDGVDYLQIHDFKQQTRSPSKFPEPCKSSANHLLSNCESSAGKMLALVGVGVGDGGGIRNAEAETWPLAAAAIRERFPATDDKLIVELIMLAIAKCIEKEAEPITDQQMAEVVRTATRPGQQSAALYKKTIPEVVKSWLRES